MSYTNRFGNIPVEPSTISYTSFNLTESITLTWASSFVDNTNVVGAQIDVTQDAANYTIKLPDATQVSVGQSIIFHNIGPYNFIVLAHDGSEIIDIEEGISWQFYLRNNTTSDGVWGLTQFGAGTSEAQASQLAGPGLVVENGLLAGNIPNKTLNISYTVLPTDRCTLLVNTGGSVTYTLLDIGTVEDGFWFAIKNNGTGTVTVTAGGTLIDGGASLVMNPGQSCYIVAVTPQWNTIGLGTPTYFQSTYTPIAVVATAQTLSPQQQGFNIQEYTGALTGDTVITYAASAGSWYVYNATTGAYTLTLQLNNANPGIIVPQGERIIAYSDGTFMYLTPTVIAPGSLVFTAGDAGTPGIRFLTNNSGFFLQAPGSVGFSSSGTETIRLGAAQLLVPSGSVGAPGLGFKNFASTGMLASSASGGTLSLSILGVVCATFNSGSSQAGVPSSLGGGYNQFFATPTTVGFEINGVNALTITNAGNTTLAGSLALGSSLSIAYGGTGASSAISAFSALSPTTTRGDLIFRNATVNARLAASTVSYLLQTNGTTADPTWVSPATVFNNGSPMTTLNDLIVGGSSGTATRLPAIARSVLGTNSVGTVAWTTPAIRQLVSERVLGGDFQNDGTSEATALTKFISRISTNSSVFIMIQASISSQGTPGGSFQLKRTDSNASDVSIYTSTFGGSNAGSAFFDGNYYTSVSGASFRSGGTVNINFLDTGATGTNVTYTLWWKIATAGGVNTIFLNQLSGLSNIGGASSITLMEVGGT